MDMANRMDTIVKSDALHEASERLTQANAQLGELDRRIRRAVREQPVLTLLGAALVGHLVGRLFARA